MCVCVVWILQGYGICFSGKLKRFVYKTCAWLQLAADPDQNVRSGSELLDRLLKVCLLVHVLNIDTL